MCTDYQSRNSYVKEFGSVARQNRLLAEDSPSLCKGYYVVYENAVICNEKAHSENDYPLIHLINILTLVLYFLFYDS